MCLLFICGHSKQLTAGESQSHQNRFKRSKMLLGLEGRECHVMPYLVHRLIRANGGLDGASDCITWLFWVPYWNKLLIDFRGVLSFFSFEWAFSPRNWRRSSAPACSPTALRLPLPTCASCEIQQTLLLHLHLMRRSCWWKKFRPSFIPDHAYSIRPSPCIASCCRRISLALRVRGLH